MRTKLRKALAAIGIVMIVLVVVAGILVGIYLSKGVDGLLSIPGVTALLGLEHPKDLQMGDIEAADRDSLLDKLGADPTSWPNVVVGSPTRSVTVSLTAKEAAALLSSGRGPDYFYDIQVAPKGPGLLAISGMMKVDGALALADMKRADVEGMVGALPDEVPIYAEIQLAPADGSLGITIRQLRIGAVLVPGSSLGVDAATMDLYTRKFFLQAYGIGLQSIMTDGTLITVEMDVPTT